MRVRAIGAMVLCATVLCATVTCSDSRDDPPAGSRPSSSQGAGAMGQGGDPGSGGSAPVSCDDPSVRCEVYGGDCTGFPGTQVQWEFLTYETVTPEDARVEFAARTADTEPALESASFQRVSTAEAGSEDVLPSDPVRLYDELDAGDELLPWLELRMRSVAATGGAVPEVVGWELTFSCVDM